MLKRVFWLSLVCVAFLLLLTLMVQEGDLPRPQPMGIQAFYALAPVVSSGFGDEQAPETSAKAEDRSPEKREQTAANTLLLTDRPYHQQAYHAFHYSDEAG